MSRKGYANQVQVDGQNAFLTSPILPFWKPHTGQNYSYLHELGHPGGRRRDKNLRLRTTEVNADFSPAANAIILKTVVESGRLAEAVMASALVGFV
ncbi:MAG: hypothetical protein LBT53_04735 [Puniceicoccales bacterium]|nr:hypothetical protein [Puniceicoccales bacterium]